MQRRVAWVGVLTVAAALLGGCAEAPSRSELVQALEASGIATERAECAADAVLDELSEEEIIELVERGPAGAPRDDPEATDDASDRVRDALAACQQVAAPETSTTSTVDGSTVDATSTSDAGTATEVPSSVPTTFDATATSTTVAG
jgi:hypothetical protein